METKELIRLLKEYNPGAEHITLSSALAKLKSDQDRFHVLNSGPPGTGKTTSSIRLWLQLANKDTILLDNTTTTRGLFETIMNYPSSDIILDECSTLLKDKKSQEMIKRLLEGNGLVWTKKGTTEETTPYTGHMVINTNESVIPAVADRMFVNRTTSDKASIIVFNNYFGQANDGVDKESFVKYVNAVIKKPVKGLSKEEVAYVLSFVNKAISDNEENDGYSRRIIFRLLSYYARVKTFFGKLDDEVKGFVEPIAETYIMNKSAPGLIESLIPAEGVDKPALVRMMSARTGYTETHCRRIINEKISDGVLLLEGRTLRKVKK